MTNEQLIPRPVPVGLNPTGGALHGSPAAIEHTALALMGEIQRGSVDAESFADNVGIAMRALGISLPDAFVPMIVATIKAQWVEPVPA